jgi:reactive intermediate/imine deaminase
MYYAQIFEHFFGECHMSKKIIYTDNAPKAIGPYSQGVIAGGFLFISGQVPIDPKNGDVLKESIEIQTNQVINNIENICKEAGCGLSDIVKITIYLTDLGNFADVNKVMIERFEEPYPARSTIEISALPLGVNVEIDAVVNAND